MTGILSQMAMYFLKRTCQRGEVVDCLFIWENNWNVSSSTQAQTKEITAHGLELRDANMGDTVGSFHCSLPDQEEGAGEAFCGQLEIALCSWALVLLGVFNHTHICQRSNKAWHTEVTADHWRKLFGASGEGVNEEKCIAEAYTNKPGGTGWRCEGWDSLGCCDHEIAELRILLGGGKAVSRTRNLNLQRADLSSSKTCLEESHVLGV